MFCLKLFPNKKIKKEKSRQLDRYIEREREKEKKEKEGQSIVRWSRPL